MNVRVCSYGVSVHVDRCVCVCVVCVRVRGMCACAWYVCVLCVVCIYVTSELKRERLTVILVKFNLKIK